MRTIRAIAMLLGALSLIPAFPRSGAGQTPAGDVIYACVEVKPQNGRDDDDDHRGRAGSGLANAVARGDLRIVPANEPCRRKEVRISWNVVGPQGPAGPTGPMGPQGPRA